MGDRLRNKRKWVFATIGIGFWLVERGLDVMGWQSAVFGAFIFTLGVLFLFTVVTYVFREAGRYPLERDTQYQTKLFEAEQVIPSDRSKRYWKFRKYLVGLVGIVGAGFLLAGGIVDEQSISITGLFIVVAGAVIVGGLDAGFKPKSESMKSRSGRYGFSLSRIIKELFGDE